MKGISYLLVGAFLLFSVAGCQPNKGDNVDRDKQVQVNFRQLSGNGLPKQIANWLENNKESEQAMLVNDEGQFYAVVTRGRKNTGGYGVSIENITLYLVDGKSRLKIGVNYTDPAPDAMLTQALTYPYAVAKVDLKEEPAEVEFDIKKQK